MLSLVRLALEGGGTQAQPRLDQAIQTFEKLGAKADLEYALSFRDEIG